MALPEGYSPRAGDVLILHAKVKFITDAAEERIHVKHEYHSFSVKRSNVVGVALFHFEVGETVRIRSSGNMDFWILAIVGEHAWIQPDDVLLSPQTILLSDLILAPVQKPQQEKTDDHE